jgi:GAF domain-containing protein
VHSSAAATELHVEISNSSKREVRLGELFVTLADTLVAGFDLSDLLQTLIDQTIEFLPVDASALFLAGPDGVLKVAAASSSHAKAVEVLILEAKASPCRSAYESSRRRQREAGMGRVRKHHECRGIPLLPLDAHEAPDPDHRCALDVLHVPLHTE